MFKRFAVTIIGIVTLSLIITVTSIFTINCINSNEYYNNFIEQKQNQINFYIEEIIDDMTSGRLNYATSTESIEHLNEKDSQWLRENVVGQSTEEKLYSTDYIFIGDEALTHIQESGGRFKEELLKNDLIKDTLHNNVTHIFSAKLDGQQAIIIAAPFKDNENKNPEGLYISVSFLNEVKLKDMAHKLQSEKDSIRIISQEQLILNHNKFSKNIIVAKRILESNQFVEMKFENKEVYNIFFLQRNYILYIVCISSLCICIVFILFVNKVIGRIRELSKNIAGISEGEYKTVIPDNESWHLCELDEVVSAVNKMASDINDYLVTIDKNYLEMVEVIVSAVEINDAYTSRHNIEVGNYARVIADEVSYENVEDIILAAKLHDIGKISVPSHILNKTGKLTEEEYDIIKIHPTEGYKIIQQIDYFSHIKLGVKYHHEHWDGKGYPEGLKGEEIPLIAQIISIADVYDAITSDRSYRKGLTHEKAVEIIISESGKLFNPILVHAFINRVDDFKTVLSKTKHRR